MKLDKSDIPAIIGLLFVMFLLGVLVGGMWISHYIKSNPEKYGLSAKSTKQKCSCHCCGGFNDD